jgi:hypothetical protein
MRRKAAIVWLWLANLLLAFAPASFVLHEAGRLTDHSLASYAFTRGFDMAALVELIMKTPDRGIGMRATSMFTVLMYAFVVLFVTAGIVQSFLSDERLGMMRFYQACGAFFWRFVRVALVTAVISWPILLAAGAIRGVLTRAADNASTIRPGIYVGLITFLLVLIVGLALRLWFDAAEFEMVSEDKRSAFRSFGAATKRISGHFAGLLARYVIVAIIAVVGVAVLLLLWNQLPPGAVFPAFVIGQVIALWCVAMRLWQRAIMAMWYRVHLETRAAETPIVTEPVRLDTSSLVTPSTAPEASGSI